MAPASRIASWLVAFDARLRSAPAAFCAATDDAPPCSSATSRWIPPTSRIASWLVALFDARLRSAAAACSAAAECDPPRSTFTR
eukprot:3244560-Prymnesium_polylepis.1